MKEFYRRLSISRKLVMVFTVICILSISASSFTIYHQAARRIDETAVTFARSINSQVVANMENFATTYQGLMLSVLVDNDILSDLFKDTGNTASKAENVAYVNKMIFRLVKMQPNIIYAGIILNNGASYQNGITGEKKDIADLLEAEWLQEALNRDDSFSIVPMHLSRYSNRTIRQGLVSVVQKLRGGTSKSLGFVLLDVDPESIVDLGKEIMGENGIAGFQVIVENREHQIIYDSAQPDLTELHKDGIVYYKEPGNEYAVITEKIENYNLEVHTIYPKSSLVLRRVLLIIITILVVLVCIVLSILLAFLFSRSFTRPIHKLEEGFSAMEKEKYVLVEGENSEDEFGTLIRHYNRMVEHQAYLTQEVYRADIQKKDAKLTALQAQINPHMLFNTLESIRMKALLAGNKDVAKMTLLLGKMFRTALEDVNNSHLIKDEIEYVCSFLELQNLRFKTENILEVDVPSDIMELPCMTMLLQPLVENSLEHGRKENMEGMKIRIHAQKTKSKLILTIQDDGRGMEADRMKMLNQLLEKIHQGNIDAEAFTEEGRRHIGIENTAKRLHLQYEGKAWLLIADSSEKGTCIEIGIQMD